VNRTLKNVLLVGLGVVIPGASLIWLYKFASYDAEKEDFKQYVEQRFDKMKADEQQWLH
jgi:hypothetical protein